jgi:hypothetical protein
MERCRREDSVDRARRRVHVFKPADVELHRGLAEVIAGDRDKLGARIDRDGSVTASCHVGDA